jgi:hypothetical protein
VFSLPVIPAKAGIQLFPLTSFPRKRESILIGFALKKHENSKELDSGLRRNDERGVPVPNSQRAVGAERQRAIVTSGPFTSTN